jgi:superfamily II DNA or RNA helicase
MKTEHAELPAATDPHAPARGLRALAERLLEYASNQVNHWERMPGPPWLERDLADCENFIRSASSASGQGLDYEGGRLLAEAKNERRELRRMREEAVLPYRRSAEVWRGQRARLALALKKSRGHGAQPQHLRELLALVEDLGRPLAEKDIQTLREARANIRRLETDREAAHRSPSDAPTAVRLSREDSQEVLAFGPRAPGIAEPDPELLNTYLPPPSDLEFEPEDREMLERFAERRYDAREDYRLNQAAQRLSLLSGFEVLLCTPLLRGVEQHAFQVHTARQVMRTMRGRALLCDEVGLGKTIEAGIVLKEYAVRGLARSVLILTPPSLVSQWREEMRDKFQIDFATLDDSDFRRHGPNAWERCERVIASIHTAKAIRHSEAIRRVAYDLIIVDEAHHLRNRASLSWKFVNQLKSKYLLLLTATPAQNDLDELYNLITLLRPGQLRTPAEFRREFVERNDPRRPRNRTKLRELLMDVMVRNTRSQVSLQLPPRHAATLRIALTPSERALYDGVTRIVRANYGRETNAHGRRALVQTLQAEAGSSAEAVRATLEGIKRRSPAADQDAELDAVLELARTVGPSSKAQALLDLLINRLGPNEKVLVFTKYLETQAFLTRELDRGGVTTARFNGTLTPAEKDAEIAAFARDRHVLLSTDVGSEGRNLQFCHSIVNYDLPWNPMRIEQRIGRVHRIGQTEPVRIFNLAAPETIEDHILEVLDSKINMFELVVGEVGEILGNLDDEREFEDIVLDLWAGADSDEVARTRFSELGDQLVGAQRRHQESKVYDDALFGQDFAAEE